MLSEKPRQNVINCDLFRIDRSSYISHCHSPHVVFKVKLWLPQMLPNFDYGRQTLPTGVKRENVYRKCQQIDPTFDSQGINTGFEQC